MTETESYDSGSTEEIIDPRRRGGQTMYKGNSNKNNFIPQPSQMQNQFPYQFQQHFNPYFINSFKPGQLANNCNMTHSTLSLESKFRKDTQGTMGLPNSNSGTATSETSEALQDLNENTSDTSESVGENPWNHAEGMLLHFVVLAYATTYAKEGHLDEVVPEALSWTKIATHFPDHDEVSCYKYWRAFNPETTLVKSSDKIVYKHNNSGCCFTEGSGSDGMRKRKRRKVKVREPWTEEECTKFDVLQERLGNKWTRIAEEIGTGRTGNEVKNYWHSMKDKITVKRFRRDNRKTKEKVSSL